MSACAPGSLLLIPTPLFLDSGLESIPPITVAALAGVRVLGVETPKVARRWVVAARKQTGGWDGSLEDTQFVAVNEPQAPEALLSWLLKGNNVGLVSDAGCPAVADPGARVVAAAHAHQLPVVPLPGPSSILMAVMASGFNGQQFSFHGYLPVKPPERRAALKRLEAEVRRTGSTQLCIETPHRNAALLEDCLAALAPSTHLCIAYNLGSPQQWVRTQSLGEWRNKLPNWAKEPALFGLGVPQG